MKRLTIRLSSLGDVILAAAALPQNEYKKGEHYFLTSEPYVGLFEGISNLSVISFQKRGLAKTSLKDLAAKIVAENFDEVVDLQSSTRTQLLRAIVFFETLKSKKRQPIWKVYRKERVRRFLFVVLKRFCPEFWRPRPVHQIWADLAGVSKNQSSTLNHLRSIKTPDEIESFTRDSVDPKMIAVMPSSIWPAKEINVDMLTRIFKSIDATYIILGTLNDHASVELYERLKKSGVSVVNGIQKWSLPVIGAILSKVKCYVGADTGLAHLSEAVGTPAVVLFGPTRKDFGFGPRLKISQSIETSLGCSPCGKDGRYCFRLTNRYFCQKMMPEDLLKTTLLNLLKRSP